jgi:hypothetical protein
MALIKFIDAGDELVFDLRDKKEEATEISVTLVSKAGRKAVLQIRADRSIEVKHFRQVAVGGQS